MEKIELEFDDKTLPSLADWDYGNEVYKEQVDQVFEQHQDETITVVFPDRIELIASSFVQGFLDKLFGEYGFDETKKRLNIITRSDDMTNQFWKDAE